MRNLVSIASACTASSNFPTHLLWQPLVHETRLVYYLQGRASLQPVGQDGQAAPFRSVLAGRKENRFDSSDGMSDAPENLSRRFVALDLPHDPRTSHLIVGRFQRRQHAGVGQIQNLLETAPDHEVNVGFARSVNHARGRYPGLSFNSSGRGGCRDVQRFECAARSETASKHPRTQPGENFCLPVSSKVLMHKPQIYESMEWAVSANKRHAPKRSFQFVFREHYVG